MDNIEIFGNTIWKSTRNIIRTNFEIDAIIKVLQEKLGNIGAGYQHDSSKSQENFHAPKFFIFWGNILSGDETRETPLGCLTYIFSLWREEDEAGDSWAGATQAKIYVGYATYDAGGWGWDDLVLNGDGDHPFDGTISRQPPYLWIDRGDGDCDDKPWDLRSWFYVVPLAAINTPDDVGVNLVDPVAALLDRKNQEGAFANTSAFEFRR